MPVSNKTIAECKKNNKEAQKEIFECYAPQVFATCIRYVKEKAVAEDILQDTFITVFLKISQYKGTGALGGWIKKIAVNNALMYLKESKKNFLTDDTEFFIELEKAENNEENNVGDNNKKQIIESADFSSTEMLEIINLLPKGFRTIFNLYTLEGYKHKEIAKLLGISIGTSKSQLLRARKKLQDILYDKALQKKKQE